MENSEKHCTDIFKLLFYSKFTCASLYRFGQKKILNRYHRLTALRLFYSEGALSSNICFLSSHVLALRYLDCVDESASD